MLADTNTASKAIVLTVVAIIPLSTSLKTIVSTVVAGLAQTITKTRFQVIIQHRRVARAAQVPIRQDANAKSQFDARRRRPGRAALERPGHQRFVRRGIVAHKMNRFGPPRFMYESRREANELSDSQRTQR
jgi:hypothetical protein